jgi:opacity protein-like surface antigen
MLLFLYSTTSAVSAADVASTDAGVRKEHYLSLSGGLSFADATEFETVGATGEIFFHGGWTGSAALGIHLTNTLRSEVELSIHTNDLEDEYIDGLGTIELDGNVSVVTTLAKLAYDFDLNSLKPFVAIGIGLAHFEAEIQVPITGSDHDTVLAGAVEGGFAYVVSDRVDLFTKAQLLVLGDVTLDPAGTGDSTLDTPLLVSGSAGIRIGF